jgi:hypothetical protein
MNEGYVIAQQYIDKYLGEYLTTEIMTYIWSAEYYTNVTKPLVQNKKTAYKMHIFLAKNILPIVNTIHQIQNQHYLVYLKYFNSFLYEIADNPGLRLYLVTEFPYLRHVTHFITRNRFNGVNTSYMYICNYCLSLSNNMRYHVITNFKKLNDINGDLTNVFTTS